MLITIGGLDPSLSNFGMSKGQLDIEKGSFELTDLKLVETSSSKVKGIRKNADDIERCKKLYTGTQEFFHDTNLIFVEVPVGSQSARAMMSYGACVALLGAMTDKSLIQVTPNDVKLCSVGSKTASKEDMIQWAISEYPNAPWLTRVVKGETTYVNKNEHLADSVAAIHAGVQTDQFKQARTLLMNSKGH